MSVVFRGGSGARGARRDASIARSRLALSVKRNQGERRRSGDADSAMIAAGGNDAKYLSE